MCHIILVLTSLPHLSNWWRWCWRCGCRSEVPSISTCTVLCLALYTQKVLDRPRPWLVVSGWFHSLWNDLGRLGSLPSWALNLMCVDSFGTDLNRPLQPETSCITGGSPLSQTCSEIVYWQGDLVLCFIEHFVLILLGLGILCIGLNLKPPIKTRGSIWECIILLSSVLEWVNKMWPEK